MTPETFKELTEDVIPSLMKNMSSGKEFMLVMILYDHPSLLEHRTLQWFIDTYINPNYRQLTNIDTEK